MAPLVFVGIGGNQGEPLDTFGRALDKIHSKTPILGISRLYRSAPLGPVQPDFLNAAFVVRLESGLPELLLRLQTVEAELGRVRLLRWGPRSVDLDILWAQDRTHSTSSLTIPHRELRHRAFALRPLLDLEPWAKDPCDGARYDTILSSLNDQDVEVISGSNWWSPRED